MLIDVVSIAFPMVIGLLFAASGVHGIWKQRRLARAAERTTGTVVDVERRYVNRHNRASQLGRNGAWIIHPVLEFQARDGGTVRAVAQFGDNLPRRRVGKTVPVLYDPDDPQTAQIDTVWGRGNFVHWLFGVVGVVVFGIAAYHLLS